MLESTPSGDVLGHDPWQLVERTPDAQRAALHETLFGLGNGRIGVRGAHEEGARWPGTTQDAIFINGFHDTEAIHYPERAHGLARENQFVVAVPNGKAIAWSIEDEAFDPTRGRIEGYRRCFDFKAGRLTREFVWISPRGRRVAVRSVRLVCLARASIYAIEYELRVLDSATRIVLESSIDARAPAGAAHDEPSASSGDSHERRTPALERIGLDRTSDRILLTHRTRRSQLQLVSAALQQLQVGGRSVAAQVCGEPSRPGLRYELELRADERVVLTQYCALVSSLDHPATELAAQASEQLASARAAGFNALCDEQRAFLARHWHDSDVEIDGDVVLQQGLRFNLLQLLQSVGRDGRTQVAARGVAGSGRDGHCLGDTEVYVFPVMLHTQPATARKLLEYRFGRLDAARARAREMSHPRGALFPWRTIAGEECSANFATGTAQVHVNAGIALAVKRYWEATGDDAFMLDCGAELVIETARIWIGLGHFEPSHDADDPPRRFAIHAVTGPDEYTALVNNNLYTNAMARMHLRFAIDIVRWLGTHHAGALQRIGHAIAFDPSEPTQWQQAAARMYIPYDRARGIHPQDDSFLSKPRWEVSDIDPAQRPLSRHHHPLVIYRHQVCKQADVLLALLLLDDEFYPADKRRNFDYYEPLTMHDSALSRCVFGIVASEVGCPDKAYRYFVDTVRLDLDDHHGNTACGVHTAAMAGSWLGVVAGFAGLRVHRGVPSFTPTLPRAWTRYAFKLRIGEAQLRLSVDQHGSHYRLLEGRSLTLQHHGQSVVLNADQPLSIFAA